MLFAIPFGVSLAEESGLESTSSQTAARLDHPSSVENSELAKENPRLVFCVEMKNFYKIGLIGAWIAILAAAPYIYANRKILDVWVISPFFGSIVVCGNCNEISDTFAHR